MLFVMRVGHGIVGRVSLSFLSQLFFGLTSSKKEPHICGAFLQGGKLAYRPLYCQCASYNLTRGTTVTQR